MIEFKAECGHTVRARDEDAGGVVRCSYCGRNAAVPDDHESDLDFLFADVQQPEAEERGRGRRRARRTAPPKVRKKGEFNPFPIILRLCYAAALIIIVVVVARKYVMPLFDEQKRPAILSRGAKPPPREDAAAKPSSRSRGPGLIREGRTAGLHVSSVPPGALVFCLEESKAPASGRISRVAGCVQTRAPGDCAHASEGSYVVEVAFPWNDPNLSDPGLPNYQNYVEFRRKIEHALSEPRKQLMEDYFVPDEAAIAFVDQTEDQIFLVRQYRGVSVRGGQGGGVRALFLPRLPGGGRKPFQIEPLVTAYIGTTKNYEFDEKHVRSELAYYGVADVDQSFVIEALSRVGAIPYPTADRRVRMFKIGIADGAFSTRIVREATE